MSPSPPSFPPLTLNSPPQSRALFPLSCGTTHQLRQSSTSQHAKRPTCFIDEVSPLLSSHFSSASPSSKRNAIGYFTGLDQLNNSHDIMDQKYSSEAGWVPKVTALVLGQAISFSISGTSIFSTYLAQNGVDIPTFQSLFNYVLCALYIIPRIYMSKDFTFLKVTIFAESPFSMTSVLSARDLNTSPFLYFRLTGTGSHCWPSLMSRRTLWS